MEVSLKLQIKTKSLPSPFNLTFKNKLFSSRSKFFGQESMHKNFFFALLRDLIFAQGITFAPKHFCTKGHLCMKTLLHGLKILF